MTPCNKHGGCTPRFSVLVLLLSAMLLGACPDGNNGGSTAAPSTAAPSTAVPSNTSVTNITVSNITTTTLTLNWVNPIDNDGFQGILISADPADGTLATPQEQPASATTAAIADLSPLTTYSFTLTSRYTNSSKNSSSPVTMATTASMATLPIDADGDGLVDITSLERLDSIRYNLDLSGGLYKRSATDVGVQCGAEQEINCTGYELVSSLDFTNPAHYDSGMVNTDWRPQDSNGTVLAQEDADDATNMGWQPIAYGEVVGVDARVPTRAHTPFNALFEGNHHTISNLYVRRRGTVGLFGDIRGTSIIRNTGVVAAALYGSDDRDTIGGLIGHSDGGTVIASYAEGSINGASSSSTDRVGGLIGSAADSTIIASSAGGTVNASSTIMRTSVVGGDSTQYFGGLVGSIYSTRTTTIIASYASSAVTGGVENAFIGGLVGHVIQSATIIASYATGDISGGMGVDRAGGLMGENGGTVTIAASYATGDISGGAAKDSVGGLQARLFGGNSRITASYATGMVDGGGDDDGTGGIVRLSMGTITTTYGFGSVTDPTNTIGEPPGSATSAAELTEDTAGIEWNDATELTLDAWDFGDDTQAPVLRYADYDGADNNAYGCIDANTPITTATIVIPSVVPDGMGGTINIECGTTPLPGQAQ